MTLRIIGDFLYSSIPLILTNEIVRKGADWRRKMGTKEGKFPAKHGPTNTKKGAAFEP